jgi:hypothetical protein
MSFFYQAGKVICNKPWQNPSPKNIKMFIDGMQTQLHTEELTAWVCGSCAYKEYQTNDFDIWFTGKVTDYQSLEDIFHIMYDYALNVCLLKIDLKWVNCDINNTVSLKNGQWTITSFKQIHLTPTIKKGSNKDFNNDYSIKPYYSRITNHLVESNFSQNRQINKKLLSRLEKDGNLRFIKIDDFLLSIDKSV